MIIDTKGHTRNGVGAAQGGFDPTPGHTYIAGKTLLRKGLEPGNKA